MDFNLKLYIKALYLKEYHQESEKTANRVGKYLQNLQIIYLIRNLYTEYIKNSYNSTLKHKSIFKIEKRFRHFFKEDTQRVSKLMKRQSTSSVIENVNQNTVRCLFTPSRKVETKKKDSNKC
jgi:hypothetical protein